VTKALYADWGFKGIRFVSKDLKQSRPRNHVHRQDGIDNQKGVQFKAKDLQS
jgi:hypothetical protein